MRSTLCAASSHSLQRAPRMVSDAPFICNSATRLVGARLVAVGWYQLLAQRVHRHLPLVEGDLAQFAAVVENGQAVLALDVAAAEVDHRRLRRVGRQVHGVVDEVGVVAQRTRLRKSTRHFLVALSESRS